VDTTVIVKDTNTVVIGGLIDDNFAVTEQKVPCLGDIPLLKMAFSANATSNNKTNLYVFLTPHVIKSPSEAEDIYSRKKEQIDKVKEGNIKMYRRKSGDLDFSN
jgi:general secretion pathway protein D